MTNLSACAVPYQCGTHKKIVSYHIFSIGSCHSLSAPWREPLLMHLLSWSVRVRASVYQFVVYICRGSHCFYQFQCRHLGEKTMERQRCDILTILKLNPVSSLRFFFMHFHREFTIYSVIIILFFLMLRKILCFMMQDLRMGTGPTPKTGDTVVVGQPSFLLAFVPCFTPY